jgi:hypothetical protein
MSDGQTFYEMLIQPCAAGGAWEFEAAGSDGEAWTHLEDLIQAIKSGVAPAHMVDVRDCVAWGAPDIRGRIRDEPVWVFAVVSEYDETYYVGIASKYD